MTSALLIKVFDRKLDAIIQEDLPILTEVKKFVIKSGGKRLRPLIHYYLTQLLGYEGEQWADVGAIGELVHSASLLHDDVVDEASVRRGKPSVNAIHGNKSAVLIGDYLLSCGLDHLGSLECSQELLAIFTRVIRVIAVGELLQVQWENHLRTPEEVYERIIRGKTASLFGAMSQSAAVLSGFSRERALDYREFGESMGRVFQIRDDFLDYFGNEEGDGKTPFQDFKRGVVTRPVIILRHVLDERDRKELERMWVSEEERRAPGSINILVDLARKKQVRRKLALEIETGVHGLMQFVRQHSFSEFRESMLGHMQQLLVPVEEVA